MALKKMQRTRPKSLPTKSSKSNVGILHPDEPPRLGHPYADSTANHVFMSIQSNRMNKDEMETLEGMVKEYVEKHNRPRDPGLLMFHSWVRIFP